MITFVRRYPRSARFAVGVACVAWLVHQVETTQVWWGSVGWP